MPVRMELVNLAEIEQIAVKVEPLLHATRRDRLREVIDIDQPDAAKGAVARRRMSGERPKVDIEDRSSIRRAAGRLAAVPSIDKVHLRVADALNRRNRQFTLANAFPLECAGAEFNRSIECTPRIVDTNADRA